MSYYRTTYRGQHFGFWIDEEIDGMDSEYRARIERDAETCRKRGILPPEDSVGYIESLIQSDLCPPPFHGVGVEDEIKTVHIELRTTTNVE
jgi:hypothetical protein